MRSTFACFVKLFSYYKCIKMKARRGRRQKDTQRLFINESKVNFEDHPLNIQGTENCSIKHIEYMSNVKPKKILRFFLQKTY